MSKGYLCFLCAVLVSLSAIAAVNGGIEEKAAGDGKALIDDPAVLVYMGLCTDGQDYAGPALANLDITNVTTVYTGANLQTELASGAWDLVIYDGYYSFLNASILDDLNAYLAAGGRIIFSDPNAYSFAAHALFTAAGVTVVNDYTAPEPIYRWQSDPLFTTPNDVPDISIFSDLCNRDGVHLEPVVDEATAHAGATATEEIYEALLTVNAGRSFIFNGFSPQTVSGDEDGDTTPDMVELYENEIYHLLAGGHGVLTFFSSCGGGADTFTAALDWWSDSVFPDRTMTETRMDFKRQIDSGTWDLVIFDCYNTSINADTLDAVVRHYDRGGKTIFYSWNMASHTGHDFEDRAGATALSSYSTPQPVYDWDTSRLFDNPLPVSDITSMNNLCSTDGQYLQATTGTACAGNTATYDATKAAIILDPHRRLIWNGFAPQNVADGSQMTKLYVNEISMLMWGGRGVLAYFSSCGGTDFISPALSELGLTDVTMATDSLDFLTHLGSGYWDLIVYEAYANPTSEETLDALVQYAEEIYTGLHLVISTYDLANLATHPLFAERAGITVSGAYSAPLPVYPWEGSVLFESPNVVPNLETLNDLCGIDGQYLDVTTATAQAGYSASPEASNAAITISPDKRIIVNAFMPQLVSQDADIDGTADMTELYANEFLFAKIGGSNGTLLYFDACSGANYASTAMSNLGMSNTIVTESDQFRTYLAAGEWGLVVYDSYSFSPPLGAFDDLVNYYDAGGRIILSCWDLAQQSPHPLFDRAGITVGSNYDSVLPVYVWDISPLFDTPNVVPNLTALNDACMIDGQYLQADSATAFAGFTATPETGMAAITADPTERFLVNGFMPQNVIGDEDGDTELDMVELYENELHYVLNGDAERQCPDGSMFSQRPMAYLDYANGFYSDIESDWTVCDDFSGLTEAIGELTWWGLRIPTTGGNGFIPVDESFLVSFCQDDSGQPGAVVYEETLTPIRETIGLIYFGSYLYRYQAALTTPVSMESGWVKIRSVDEDNCWWAWLTSNDGNLNSFQEGFGLLNWTDFSLCFTAGATGVHTADQNDDGIISLSELLRIIQFFNSNGYHCEGGTEDGYAPGPGDTSCAAHNSDYNPQDWHVNLSELLRVIQFFNSSGYHYCPSDGTEDGYCPGPAKG